VTRLMHLIAVVGSLQSRLRMRRRLEILAESDPDWLLEDVGITRDEARREARRLASGIPALRKTATNEPPSSSAPFWCRCLSRVFRPIRNWQSAPHLSDHYLRDIGMSRAGWQELHDVKPRARDVELELERAVFFGRNAASGTAANSRSGEPSTRVGSRSSASMHRSPSGSQN